MNKRYNGYIEYSKIDPKDLRECTCGSFICSCQEPRSDSSEQGTAPQVGQVIFAAGEYRETVILEIGEVQLVLCMDGAEFKLYRLVAPLTNIHNMAYYTSAEALAAYQQAAACRAK